MKKVGDRNYMTTGEVSDRLGVSRESLYRWRGSKTPDLEYITLGHAILYVPESVEDYLTHVLSGGK